MANTKLVLTNPEITDCALYAVVGRCNPDTNQIEVVLDETIPVNPTTDQVTFGSVLVDNGSAASPSVSFSGDTDTGIYRLASNALGFTSNGTVGFFLAANRVTFSRPIGSDETVEAITSTGTTAAIDQNTSFTDITTTTGADALTLADSTIEGIRKIITIVGQAATTDVVTITVASGLGFSTIEFDANGVDNTGSTVELIFKEAAWRIVSTNAISTSTITVA